MKGWAMAGLVLRDRRRRILGLVAFAALFLAAAIAARLLTGGEDGHVEMDRLFTMGGYPLVSALLLLGWMLGRFPMIAVLVLMAGFYSADRRDGQARLYLTRPTSPLGVYAVRWLILILASFALSAVLMPAFDMIMLGALPGIGMLALAGAYILVYGGLTALVSVWVRGDAWIAAGLAIAAMVWDALRRADALAIAPGARDFIGFLLPPQSALFQLETAFGQLQPVPWGAFIYCAAYGLVMLALAGVSMLNREV